MQPRRSAGAHDGWGGQHLIQKRPRDERSCSVVGSSTDGIASHRAGHRRTASSTRQQDSNSIANSHRIFASHNTSHHSAAWRQPASRLPLRALDAIMQDGNTSRVQNQPPLIRFL
uniref:Uncharacterized protein n=1 Tax=Oryza nivara TaxID=4536 RepID=A0A0E0GXE6_ORYNI